MVVNLYERHLGAAGLGRAQGTEEAMSEWGRGFIIGAAFGSLAGLLIGIVETAWLLGALK